MDVFEAKDELWSRISKIRGIRGIGVYVRNNEKRIIVYGGPLALMKIPSFYKGFIVVKRVSVLATPRFKAIPRSTIKMAERISKSMEIPFENVLKSRPIREHAKKVKKEDNIVLE